VCWNGNQAANSQFTPNTDRGGRCSMFQVAFSIDCDLVTRNIAYSAMDISQNSYGQLAPALHK
jgi:hypothetical protein